MKRHLVEAAIIGLAITGTYEYLLSKNPSCNASAGIDEEVSEGKVIDIENHKKEMFDNMSLKKNQHKVKI